MRTIPLCRAQSIKPYASFLAEIGAPVDGLLRRAKLPTLFDEQPDAYIPTHLMYAFREVAARAEHTRDLGWLVGDRVWSQHAANPALLSAFRHVPTLYQALKVLCRQAVREASNIKLCLVPQGEIAWVCWQHNMDAKIPGYGQSEIFVAAAIVTFVRRWLGSDWMPARMTLNAPAIEALERQELCQETRLLVDAKTDAFMLPRTLLLRPPAADFFGLAESPSATVGAAPATDLIGALKHTLPLYFGDGYPDINTAAAIADCSTRTLQRELARFDLSYSELIEQIRFQMAAQALQDTDAKLIDISYELGYTDPGCFSRAFRRWAGVTPREYRRQCWHAVS